MSRRGILRDEIRSKSRSRSKSYKPKKSRGLTYQTDPFAHLKGPTLNPKIIIFFHGSIVGGKQLINFPYKRLIYYVNKGYILLQLNKDLPTLFQSMCSGERSSAITFKEPINDQLLTYKQKIFADPTDNEVLRTNTGIYYCSSTQPLIKLLDWDHMRTIFPYGEFVEDLVNFIIMNYTHIFRDVDIRTIDINVYACRSCPGDVLHPSNTQLEQTHGGKKRRKIRSKRKSKINKRRSRSRSRHGIIGGKKLAENVTEDVYKKFLEMPCDQN